MATARISIIGLGRIGTSLGLALRQIPGEFQLVGHDRDGKAAANAKKVKAVDQTNWNLPSSVEGAALVILALPVGEVRKVLEVISEDLSPGAVVTDTTSLKAPLVAWADELLPEGVSFIGGNPIVSISEDEDISADAFRDAVYCLTPSTKASEDAVRLISDLLGHLGAKPFFVDPGEHDGLMAAVDHLPPLLSATLINVTTGESSWREMRRVAAGRFESGTDLGARYVEDLSELYMHNQDNILRWIDRYISALQQMRELIQQEEDTEESLKSTFDKALEARAIWLIDRAEARWETEEIPRSTEGGTGMMRQLFLGNRPGNRRRGHDKD